MAKRKGKQSSCTALILHPDPRAALTLQKESYKASLEQQFQLSAQWNTYLEKDRPSFENWFFGAFEEIRTKIFTKKDEIKDIASQLEAISFYSEMTGKSHKAAAKVIFEARDKGQEYFLEFMQKFAEEVEAENAVHEDEDDYFDEEDDDDLDFEQEDPYQEFFENFFKGKPTSKKDGVLDGSSEEYFRKIYHDCVRKTHPDLVPAEVFDNDLWNTLQKAYADKDFSLLEQLKAKILGQSSANHEPATAGEFSALRLQIERKIKDLKAKMRFARNDPAWQFSEKLLKPKALKKLTKDIDEEFKQELIEVSYDLRSAREILEEFRPKIRGRKKEVKTTSKRPKR